LDWQSQFASANHRVYADQNEIQGANRPTAEIGPDFNSIEADANFDPGPRSLKSARRNESNTEMLSSNGLLKAAAPRRVLLDPEQERGALRSMQRYRLH
jgi:hypothetical protein